MDKILNAPVILIALLILAAVFFFARILFNRPVVESLPHATLLPHELEPYFQALRDSNDDYAFIIVTVVGTEDFFQFKDSGHGLFTDFPLFTERQRSLERAARDAFEAEGFVIEDLNKNDPRHASPGGPHDSVNAAANLSPKDAVKKRLGTGC